MITDITALVIVHFGEKEKLYRCVKSIERDISSNVRIIIVNNTSQVLRLEEREEILVVNNKENPGYAAACNTGIRKAQELGVTNFVLCNNDVQFTEEFFSYFLPRVKEIEYPVIVAPKINFMSKPDSVWYAGGRISKFKMEGIHITKKQKNDIYETEFISGCCMYLSKNVIDKIGFMDECYFLYDEDLDYSIRAKKNGVSLFVDTSVTIYHDESSSVRNQMLVGRYKSEIYYYRLRNRLKIIHKYSTMPYKLFNWLYVFYKSFKYLIVFLMRRELKSILLILKAFSNYKK